MDPFIVKNLNLILKVSERCNLNCHYCYFFFNGDESYKRHPPTIKLAVIDKLCGFIRQAAERDGVRKVTIGIHGGEPLLLKKPRFREVCSRLKGLEQEGILVDLVMQTNGMLIDEGWVEIISEFRIRVGISFDGPPEVHDLHRTKLKGGGSYLEARRGWDMLRAAHAEGRIGQPGVLCVIDPEQDGRAIYRHLVDDLKARSIGFLFPDYSWDTMPGGDHVAKTARYLRAVFEEWTRDRDFKLRVRHLKALVSAMILDSAFDFHSQFADDVRNQITVSSDGELGPEDVVRTLHPRLRDTQFHLPEARLEDLASSDIWAELKAARENPAEECRSCEWWGVCGGGRPWNRFSNANGFRNPSLYCSALKDMYADAAEFLVNGGLSKDELTRRLERGRFKAELAEAGA